MKKQIETLYNAFDIVNREKFNNEIPRPTLTIQTKGNANAYGWCSVNPIWISKDGENKTHEINISAEHLNRPFRELMGTLIHEMVHLHNISNGIKDVSRGGTYHNKKFKETAEAVGLKIEQHPKYGWTITTVPDELLDEIHAWGLNEEAFDIARIDFATYVPTDDKDKDNGGEPVNPKTGETKKKSSTRKYQCPCGTKIRATKEVKVICAECGGMFEEYE